MKSPGKPSRRQFLAGMVAAPLIGLLDWETRSTPRQAATFVLVHGAWHGGWCWKRVSPRLRAAGHEVYAPTLTGLGERSHLLHAEIDLDTHIADLSAVIEYEDLQDVILIGHSYAGMVIAAVANRMPDRIVQLVYLDAFLPDDGKSISDYAPLPPTREDGWRVPPPGPPTAFGITDEADVAWVQARLGDQPLKTFTQPVRLPEAANQSVKRTFIQCTHAPWFAEAADRAKREGYGYREMFSAGHDAMLTQADKLSEILLELA